MGGFLSVTGAGPASADPPVTDFGGLSAGFAAGGTVVLGGDITQSGQVLAVGAGRTVTLDLAGHSLSVTGPAGAAGIGVPSGTTLTIEDSSGGGQVTATGGTGGAGIGGDAGTAGVSTYNQTTTGMTGAPGAGGTVTGGQGGAGEPGGATAGKGGGAGGTGGTAVGTAPLTTGGNGGQGGAGGPAASGGTGGTGGAALSTGAGITAVGGDGGAGGAGGLGAPGGHGGAGASAVSTAGAGTGGAGGAGGVGGPGADGGTGGATGVVTVLGGTVLATGGAGGAGIGGGAGGPGDSGAAGGNGGAGGASTGLSGLGGRGGAGGAGGAGGEGGTGGAGGTVTISGAEVTAVAGLGAAGIGGGAGGAGDNPGAAGNAGVGGPGVDGSGASGTAGAAGAAGPQGSAGANGTVRYGPGAPSGVTATATGTSALVGFTAPASSGSSAISGYTVFATDVTDPSRGGQQATGTDSPIAVGGLTTGDVYTFTVKATTLVGTGLESAPSSPVTAVDPVVVPPDFTTGTEATIGGAPRVGQVLTADAGAVAPTPDHYTYRWYASGSRISGATSATFTPRATQLGKVITVEIGAVKSGYVTSTDTSEPTDPVARAAADLTVTAPTGPRLAGTNVKITIQGLDAGEDYTVRVGDSQVAAGTADNSGPLTTRVLLPTQARDGRTPITVTGSEPDRTGAATALVLVDKTLSSRIKKTRVPVGRLQQVTVRGLAGMEHVVVRYRGSRVSAPFARASNDGTYRVTFPVGKQRGIQTVKVIGQFPGRTATLIFRVTRR